MSAPASYPIESVENASRVLLMLRSRRVLRIADVAAELGIARSSAHRMLTTLQSQGLLRQDGETRGYGPGPQLIQIGIAVIGATDLRLEARPTIERLSRDIGETVHLLVLEGSAVVFLDGMEGRFAIRAALRVGERAPAHASAAGKVLLAALPRALLQERYPNNRLLGGTDKAIGTRRRLEPELDTVRAQGFAMNLGESEPGLHAIAAPVRDSADGVRAAISISGPSERLGAPTLLGYAAQLREAADQLGARLS